MITLDFMVSIAVECGLDMMASIGHRGGPSGPSAECGAEDKQVLL